MMDKTESVPHSYESECGMDSVFAFWEKNVIMDAANCKGKG